MLQSIRDHTQGWIAGVIISLLILSFALWGIHSYIGGGGGNESIAKVNGEEISKRQFSLVYERYRRQMQAQTQNAQLPIQTETVLKDRALQSIIETDVLKQAALAKDYRVSSMQFNSFLESLPEFQANGHFSATRFKTVLEANLYNPGDFIDLVRTSLLIDQPRLGIIFSSFALPKEVSQAVNLVNQQRDIQYLMVPSDLIKNELTIPADKIEAYYTEHQDLFKTPEQVSVEYVELDFNNVVASIKPTEDQLKKFYNENSSSFTSAALNQSKPRNSAANQNSVLPFDQVRDKVKQLYIQQQAEEKYGELREKLASISYEHPESLNEVAKDLGLKIQTTGLFTQDKGAKGISDNAKIREAAFSDDVLNKQNNSDVIQLGSERAIVLRVKTHDPARVLSLEKVKPQIIEKLTQSEREVQAKQLAENMLQQLNKGATPDSLAARYHLNWNKKGFVPRNTSTVDRSILEAAFATPKPVSGKQTFSIAKTSSGYAVIALNGVKVGPSNNKDNSQKLYADQLQNAQGLVEYELYKNSLIKNAKIKIEGE